MVLKDTLSSQEHVDLGYIYERQGKLDLAEKEYKKAIRKDKKNWLAYFNLGNVYAKRGEWEEAEEHYRRALQIRRDADILNNLAYTLSRQGRHCEAYGLIKEALKERKKKEYEETRYMIERSIKEMGVDCPSFEGEGKLR